MHYHLSYEALKIPDRLLAGLLLSLSFGSNPSELQNFCLLEIVFHPTGMTVWRRHHQIFLAGSLLPQPSQKQPEPSVLMHILPLN